ncbi:MAG: ArsR/SmtB family transcription factor [Petrotogales bacterium]
MEKLVKMFKSLSCKWRIEIIKKLSEGDYCLCELEKEIPVDKTTLSRHIKALVDAGLIIQKRTGQRKNLLLNDWKVIDLINLAKKITG